MADERGNFTCLHLCALRTCWVGAVGINPGKQCALCAHNPCSAIAEFFWAILDDLTCIDETLMEGSICS